MLERRQLTTRETALWLLIDASHERDASRREALVARVQLWDGIAAELDTYAPIAVARA